MKEYGIIFFIFETESNDCWMSQAVTCAISDTVQDRDIGINIKRKPHHYWPCPITTNYRWPWMLFNCVKPGSGCWLLLHILSVKLLTQLSRNLCTVYTTSVRCYTYQVAYVCGCRVQRCTWSLFCYDIKYQIKSNIF